MINDVNVAMKKLQESKIIKEEYTARDEFEAGMKRYLSNGEGRSEDDIKVLAETDNYILMGNVGDSSGFVIKDLKLRKVTYDHTLVNLLVSAGELTKEEASVHPKKNVLMKALGASLEIDVDIFDCDMDITGVFLSSDGLTNMLEREQIEKVLIGEGTVEEKLVKLIRKANNRGGTDNISVAYVDFREGDE